METNKKENKMKTEKQIEKIFKDVIGALEFSFKQDSIKFIKRKTKNGKEYIDVRADSSFGDKDELFATLWKDKYSTGQKYWAVSLDGASGYDYLSYEAEFGQDQKAISVLENNYNIDWHSHYRFNILN